MTASGGQSRHGDGSSDGPRGDDRRIGVVGIVVTDRHEAAARVQDVLSDFGDLIVGRMGIPYRERGVAVIALVVDGGTDRLGGLTGRLGSLPGVFVRSALTSYADPEREAEK